MEKAAQENSTVVVASDDTDVLVMLLYHCHPGSKLYFTTKLKINKNSSETMWWNIDDLKKKLPIPSNLILFAHAGGGCDTTSATYGKGKKKILKYLQTEEGKKSAAIFAKDHQSQADVGIAGQKVMLSLYGGDPNSTPSQIRFRDW